MPLGIDLQKMLDPSSFDPTSKTPGSQTDQLGVPSYLQPNGGNIAMNGPVDGLGADAPAVTPRLPSLPKKAAPVADDSDDDDSSDDPTSPKSSLDVPDLSKYQVTADDLAQARDQKRAALLAGSIAQPLANMQSIGNFMTGKMNPQQDTMTTAKLAADQAMDPIRDKQTLMKQAVDTPKNQLQLMQEAQAQKQMGDLQDPDSMLSKTGKVMLARLNSTYNLGLGDDQLTKMNGVEVSQFLDSPAMKAIMEHDRAAMSYKAAVDSARIKAGMFGGGSGDDNGPGNKQQQKAFHDVQMMLESARGNPAVAQAEKDRYASAKANSLVNLYGDPNKLSQSQVNMLVSEVGKIASGGVPAQHELEGISSNALEGKLSGVWSRLSNSPTPANAAAFIKQYQDYANALTKDANGVLKDKYSRIIETNKRNLTSRAYQELNDNYLPRVSDNSQGGQSGGGGPSAQNSNAYQQAVQWVAQNKNSTDPKIRQQMSGVLAKLAAMDQGDQ